MVPEQVKGSTILRSTIRHLVQPSDSVDPLIPIAVEHVKLGFAKGPARVRTSISTPAHNPHLSGYAAKKRFPISFLAPSI